MKRKDIIFVQKNIAINAVLLCVVMIIITCVFPLVIISNAPVLCIIIVAVLIVLILVVFIMVIYYNRVGIGFNGIIINEINRNNEIAWQNIENIEIKVFHGKALIVKYFFITQNCIVNITNNAHVLDILLKYCDGNEKLKDALQQQKSKLYD